MKKRLTGVASVSGGAARLSSPSCLLLLRVCRFVGTPPLVCFIVNGAARKNDLLNEFLTSARGALSSLLRGCFLSLSVENNNTKGMRGSIDSKRTGRSSDGSETARSFYQKQQQQQQQQQRKRQRAARRMTRSISNAHAKARVQRCKTTPNSSKAKQAQQHSPVKSGLQVRCKRSSITSQ